MAIAGAVRVNSNTRGTIMRNVPRSGQSSKCNLPSGIVRVATSRACLTCALVALVVVRLATFERAHPPPTY